MASWKDIERALAPSAEDRATAEGLLEEYREGPPVAMTQTRLLGLPDAVLATFYARLESDAPDATRPSGAADSSWMIDCGFCWVNVRACARGDRKGTFLQAAKLLPSVGAGAILLAPFHPVQFELCYAPETMFLADPAFAEPALSAAGISPAEQLRAFVSACHLLGKAAGYELLPYAAQFSRIAMEHPTLFRWVALDEERRGLAMADPDFPYRSEDRIRDAEAVAAMAAAVKEDHGIASFRLSEDDDPAVVAAKDKAYYTAIRLCIDHGLWPVPAHARRGVGIPAFLRYDGGGDFPVFSYRDADGNDLGAEAYSVVAPFAFYDDLPPNAAPSEPPPRNQAAFEYYAGVFPYWRDAFGFDFVRYNAVDNLLDEVVDEDGRVPASDRPTPEVVAAAVSASRAGAPGIGALAARKGAELEEYADLGFDLTMGSEALRRIDAPLARDAFELYDRLAAREGRPASVCFAVDVPESSAPRLWGSPLSKVMGPARMRLRHGFARFVSIGPGRRPLFETMGLQDGSTGLYEAGLSVRGLDWADDEASAAGYAAIERLYASLRPFLAAARMASRAVEPGYAWWIARAEGDERLVVVAASLETAEGAAPGRLAIPLGDGGYEGTLYRLPDDSRPVAARGSLELELGFLDMVVAELRPTHP